MRLQNHGRLTDLLGDGDALPRRPKPDRLTAIAPHHEPPEWTTLDDWSGEARQCRTANAELMTRGRAESFLPERLGLIGW
jgi:hypothetical protein